jgi:hypothetical protein
LKNQSRISLIVSTATQKRKTQRFLNVFAFSAQIETDQIFIHRLGLAIISQISLSRSLLSKNVCSIDLSNARGKKDGKSQQKIRKEPTEITIKSAQKRFFDDRNQNH